MDILPLIANDKNARDIAAELVEVSEKICFERGGEENVLELQGEEGGSGEDRGLEEE